MVFWETFEPQPDQPPAVLDFTKIWRAADKIVYSTTLEAAGQRSPHMPSEPG
ncbi:MAG: hypothetical protein QOF10_4140 [Kribbellaceae bacterium]|jgi:hypothetical protein|nr:hypothetical protein [Kribbellaceae bacterium]